MVTQAFNKLFWGFLLILLDFRIGGWDLLPDIIGFILFYLALQSLMGQSVFFQKAVGLNIAMIIISVTYMYEAPVDQSGAGNSWDLFGSLGAVLGIVGLFLSLVLVYRIFMGIADMASKQGRTDLAEESQKRWTQFLFLKVAVLFAFLLIFVPFLAAIYLIGLLGFNIYVVVAILGFTRRCKDAFAYLDMELYSE